MRLTLGLCVVLSLISAGCMRMRGSRSQTIEVQTNPPGANVTIRPGSGDFKSPAHLTLDRKPQSTVNVQDPQYRRAAYIVTVSMPGYRESSVPIEKAIATDTFMRNIVWLHPLFYGIGVAVDLSSGYGYELRPSNVFVVLEPQTAGGKE